MSGYRLPAGGAIERDRPLSFRFDGRRCSGYAGDTLASALLAEGIIQVGRSFKYHRPRGIYSAGPEEPNALVTLGADERTEPNTRATQIELYDNLEARSQNRWPSLRLDLMALNGLLSPLFVAGFYYKTFMWPARFWEPVYERFIRKAAGLGRAGREPDPDVYDRHHAFCDVLVVGAGPAGLAAARSAAEAGADVLLVDERAWAGGQLAYEHETAAGRPARDWIDDRVRELQGRDNVRLRLRTTAFGLYDGNVVGLIERVADHQAPAPGQPRQRYWIVRPAQVVLATGAIERPLSFAGNDRPGIMLAGAARGYVNRFAVAPGRRVVVAAGHDDAYRAALDLRHA
ncbi:MAG: 2Fe-2S iron-sulfur cluster-binding protein, partial [Candidatus Competibacterales bacterium]|nr:2Fe-2S iron-sulfur cluster-binding protein [Candidatus Competibacterales bacterium]